VKDASSGVLPYHKYDLGAAEDTCTFQTRTLDISPFQPPIQAIQQENPLLLEAFLKFKRLIRIKPLKDVIDMKLLGIVEKLILGRNFHGHSTQPPRNLVIIFVENDKKFPVA